MEICGLELNQGEISRDLLNILHAKKDFNKVPALSGIIPKALVMDSKGVLWIGTGEGLLAFRNDSIISTVTQDDGLAFK